MRLRASQVVEHHRDRGGLGAEAQLQVTGILGSPPVFSGDVTVVSDTVTPNSFLTDMIPFSGDVGLPVRQRHYHAPRAGQHSLDLALLFLQRIEEVAYGIWPVIYSTGGSVLPSQRTTV